MKNSIYLPVVNEGAISTPDIGDGKMIPVLILDCGNHPEFFNLVKIHQNSGLGDVVSAWGYRRLKKRHLELKLNFLKPVELEVRIPFDLRKLYKIADMIVRSKAVYLQPIESGGKVSEGIDKPKILIEIPPETKLPNWDAMVLKQIAIKLKYDGIDRKHAKNAAKEHLKRLREFKVMR